MLAICGCCGRPGTLFCGIGIPGLGWPVDCPVIGLAFMADWRTCCCEPGPPWLPAPAGRVGRMGPPGIDWKLAVNHKHNIMIRTALY